MCVWGPGVTGGICSQLEINNGIDTSGPQGCVGKEVLGKVEELLEGEK